MEAAQIESEQTKKIIGEAKERFEDMKQDRQPHETTWRMISEYVIPRRTFNLPSTPLSPRKRRLVDTTGRTSNERLAALLYGYMMPPSRPWVRPDVEGREATLSEARYFQSTQKRLFGNFMSPRSGFSSAAHESLQDDVAFGNSVMWGGAKMGRGQYRAVNLMECYWQENDEGHVDLLYRNFSQKLRVAIKNYKSPKLAEKFNKDRTGVEMIEFLHITEPRDEGSMRAIASKKPVKSIVICLTTSEIVKVSGFDSFPWAVTRFQKESGANYGEGPGWDALPLVRLLNEMEETILRAAELEADPPMVSLIGKIPTLDRRPGGLTNLSAAQIRRLTDPQQVFRRLYEGGTVSISVDLVRDIRQQIMFLYYIDWMQSLSGSGVRTATEVNDLRDIRLRSMTPIVSRSENEKLTAIADREFTIQQNAGRLDPAPASLDGEDVHWEYFSPLAQAQQLSALETFHRTLDIVERAEALQPGVTDNVDLDNGVRKAVVAAGWSNDDLRERSAVDELRRKRNEKAAREQALLEAQAAAGAARDAGQAAASVGLAANENREAA